MDDPQKPIGTGDTTPPVSADEYNAGLLKSLHGDTEAGPSPVVQSFWDKLKNGVNGKSRTLEIARSIPRGIAMGAAEVARTVTEGAATMQNFSPTGVAKQIMGAGAPVDAKKAGERVAAPLKSGIDNLLGKKSDDPLASFTEGVTQFVTGFAATRKVLPGTGKLMGLVQGAVTDATAMDPYEAQLAELVARAPVRGISDVGKLLSVHEDDAPVVARLKRATAGAIPGVVLDGLVAGARVIRAGKLGKAAPEAEKVLADIAKGEHVPEGSHVTVKETPEGTFTIKPVEWDIPPEWETPPHFADKAEAVQQAASIDDAITARMDAGQVVPQETLQETSKAFADGTLDDVSLAASHHNTVEQDVDLVKQLTDHIVSSQRNLVGSEGQVSVENAKALAKEGLSMIPEEHLDPTIKALLNSDPRAQAVTSVMADMVMGAKGRKIMQLSDVVDARPHDPVALDEMSKAIENYFDLRHALYEPEADAARRLRFVQERDAMRGEEFSSAAEGEAGAVAKPAGSPKGEVSGPEVAGMKTRDASQGALDKANAAAIGRMFKMAGGNPRDADAILHAAVVLKKGGTANAALEVFTNSLLSGPQTWATVSVSGGALSVFEALAKTAGGLGTGNRALAQEGADTMFGLFSHLGDNIKIAAAAMREGRSIVNPAPTTYAIGGVTGQVIRTPGRIMLGLDEFTRVSNYRAFVRAKSLRAGREAGLDGGALAQRVDQDLRAAFDPQTGIATIPDALKYADVPTLSSPLSPGFGKELQGFTNNSLVAKFVVPFVRASTNIFNYAWQTLPGLNLLNKQAREIIAKGGEDAAVLHARSALASSIYGYGYLQATQGNLTGRGPSDPELRRMWLKDHQPYSLKVGDTFISYARLDPAATPLGLIADTHVFLNELGDKHPDTEDAIYAVLSSVVGNMASKTYMRGLTDFADAWSKNDPHATGRYLQNLSTGFVPFGNLINKSNPDPYYREVNGMFDAIKARMPYFSESVDPMHNLFGEKVLKTPGLVNRGLNPMTVMGAAPSKVEDELGTLGRGLAPAPAKIEGGLIDLHSKDFNEKPDQPSPYVRWMELVRTQDGGLRKAMEEKINSSAWKDASDGGDTFPGGRKLVMAQALKDRFETQAFRQVKEEYPKLANQINAVRRARGQSVNGGEGAVKEVEQMFGTKVKR